MCVCVAVTLCEFTIFGFENNMLWPYLISAIFKEKHRNSKTTEKLFGKYVFKITTEKKTELMIRYILVVVGHVPYLTLFYIGNMKQNSFDF